MKVKTVINFSISVEMTVTVEHEDTEDLDNEQVLKRCLCATLGENAWQIPVAGIENIMVYSADLAGVVPVIFYRS